MYYIYAENNEITGSGQSEMTNDDVVNIKVSEEIFNDFTTDTRKYILQNNKVVMNPDYNKIIREDNIRNQIIDITNRLEELDKKRIRAVCEDEVRNEKTGETWLDFYNSQVYDLRIQIKSLEAQL